MVLTIISTLGVVIVGALSFVGCFYSTKRSTDKVTAMVEYRLEQLEKKVDKNNSVIERTFKVERNLAVLEEKIDAANNRISNLMKGEKI